MSDDLSGDKPRLPLGWLVAGAGGLLLAVLLFFATLGGSPDTNPAPGTGPGATPTENGLDRARQTLSRNTSLESCQAALQQVRSYLGQDRSADPIPPWNAAEKTWLVKQLDLTRDEQEEIGSTVFTTLDAAHLEACLLMRDAARSLLGKEDPKAGQVGLEQARAAFAWVVRQVRWQGSPSEPVPPSYVLSRGWGTALERAFVYLALLEQMGSLEGARPELLGCLLMIPAEGGKLRLWACGVVVPGGREVYLFDPRLGVPLPGPGGKGIATLEQARTQDDVLGQLPRPGKDHYDVTKAQARQAKPMLAYSLSSLAPRMRYLQETILQPSVKVRLAADPRHAHKTLQAAAGTDVSFLGVGARLLRRFLPPGEGGTDQPQQVLLASLGGFTTPDDPLTAKLGRKQLYQLGLAPWQKFPAALRDPDRFPYNVGLGDRVRTLFAEPFRRSLQEPNGPRQQMLRGRYDQAARDLMEEKDRWQEVQKQRASAGKLGPRVNEWVEEAFRVYARALKAQDPAQRAEAEADLAKLWNNADALSLFLGGAIADALQPELVYLLGLCKHEQAAQQQGAKGKQAQRAWGDAVDWWTTFVNSYPQHPAVPAVRRLRAEALEAIGDREGARAALTELADSVGGLEKIAALYQAEQLRLKK